MPYEYIVNGEKIVLNADKDLIAVRFAEPALHSTRAAVAKSPVIGDFSDRFEVPEEKYTILEVAQTPQPTTDRFAAAKSVMSASDDVARAAPVFQIGNNHVVATDRLLVGFKSDTKGSRKLLQDHGCKVLERNDDEFLVAIDAAEDPFAFAAKLNALNAVEYAEPDFVTIGKHMVLNNPLASPNPTDPNSKDQYALKLCSAIDAWSFKLGDADIKIAILDEGVDTTHEDLAAAIVGSYDGIDDDTFQEPKPWDAHGTACAGLAAGIHGNALGMQGIGGGCSLLAVRIAQSNNPRGNWVTSNSIIRRAIDWSWENGADVLSNSWGGGAPSTAIQNAFERARTKGRDGKGCVIVIAAGNDSGPVTFPGTLENVLTVSASNEFDEFKSKTSQDGESWWGSNFGPSVDIAAPGVHNFTTDISGDGGYNTETDGHYYASFNGTSSSTPIVAGAIGLVLSANKNLTEAEVREIIRSSADKIGPTPYANGRNDQMGYGRLNVLRAVKAALNIQDVVIPSGKHTPVTNQIEDEEEISGHSFQPSNMGVKPNAAEIEDSEIEVVKGTPQAKSVTAVSFSVPDDMDELEDIATASFGELPPIAKTVHGADDRVRITNTSAYPWRVHASLLITAADNSRWIGTGWFIGPRTLITAGHVVYIKNSPVPARNGWVKRIDVMAGRNGTELPYGSVTSTVFHSVIGWTVDGDPTYDYGALIIPTNLGDTVGTLGFGVLSKTELLAATGNLSGYPSISPAGTQWYDHNKIASVSSRKVFYDIDTAGGQSGAAVYRIKNGERTAFGIHAYGGHSSNSATRITTPVFNNMTAWNNQP